VAENLRLGGYLVRDPAVLAERVGIVHSLFPVVRERGRQIAGSLSGGEQQMVAVGLALMRAPRALPARRAVARALSGHDRPPARERARDP
jgi:branched-chain amino acid transport system ATP-binding protein